LTLSQSPGKSLRHWFTFHQPKASWQEIIIDLLGSAAAVGVLALITDVTHMALLWAPFGGTLVLIFAAQRSPFAQPVNVLGGHLLSAAVSLVMIWLLPHNTWTLMLTVGVVIAAMRLARVTHPPAGANPIVIFLAQPAWWVVLPALAVGALAVLLLGYLIHRMTRTEYPLKK
jgi:CBS-domain-containing membrane protein